MKEEEIEERRKRQMKKGVKEYRIRKKKGEKAEQLKGLNFNSAYDTHLVVCLKMCHKGFAYDYFANRYNA